MTDATRAAETHTRTVFISWSGDTSLRIAKFLRLWLRSIVQLVDPWISPDIVAGERWQAALGAKLAESKYGVLCVTPDNMNAPWLVFEAGVMARSFDQSRVVPLLFGVSPADLTGPLSQFQSVTGDRGGIYKIAMELHHLTESGMPETEFKTFFETLWPRIEGSLAEAIRGPAHPVQEVVIARSDREVLDEILHVVRGLRVAPTIEGIVLALKLLETEMRNDLGRLEKEEEKLTASDAPISLEDRAIQPLRQRLERIQTAARALDQNQAYASAAASSIVWLADIAVAVERLHSDLEGRELALDLRNSRDSPLYSQILNEIDQCAKLLAFMDRELPQRSITD